MSVRDPLLLGAHATARAIASGEMNATTALEARIACIEQHNPRLNAVVATRFDAARAEARQIDQRRARGEPLPPLAGVALSIKDAIDVQGLASTSGVPARATNVAQRDDAAVARWRAAGGIVLAKTNVAQALIYMESDNPLFGRCNHPERAARTAGGSSGGEAALLAVGGTALGLGTDIGGSGRAPAAFCGIASLKPTAGRLPDTQRLSLPVGELAIASQLVPMAREVADVELGLALLNPPHLRLPASSEVDVSTLRVGVYDDDGLFPCSPGVRRAVHEAADALRSAGARVVPFRIPDPARAFELFYALLGADAGAGMKRLMRGGKVDVRAAQLLFILGRSRLTRYTLAGLVAAFGQKHLAAVLRALGGCSVDRLWQLCEAQIDYRDRFSRELDEARGGALDLLIGPVVATPAFLHGATKDLGVPGVYTSLYNLLGWPAGVVPWGRVREGEESDRGQPRDLAERAAAKTEAGSAGLPLAVQVMARPWAEHQVLAAMHRLEAAGPPR